MSNKCEVNGKLVSPCDALSKSTEFGNPRGKRKGLWCWEYYTTRQTEPTRRFFGIKSGEHVEKGMAFNFCPFCGTDISDPFTANHHSPAKENAE